MKKILIGLAIVTLSTSAAFAKHRTYHHGHAMKPKAAAAAPAPAYPMMGANVSAADKAMYKKNMHDSGMKK
jgi:hypothetical protein